MVNLLANGKDRLVPRDDRRVRGKILLVADKYRLVFPKNLLVWLRILLVFLSILLVFRNYQLGIGKNQSVFANCKR